MKIKNAGRPLSVRKSTPKVEAQADQLWGQRAAQLIKAAMIEVGWSYRELAQSFGDELGVEISAVALNRRINRGNFSAGFLLMCRDVLRGASAKGVSTTKIAWPKREAEIDTLEGIVDGWGIKRP